MTVDDRTTLDGIASCLRKVHKLLLDREKHIYEKTYGRLENPYQLLGLAMDDPQFAWLRAMSGEMVHLDEVRLSRTGIDPQSVRLIGTRIRALIFSDGTPTTFQQNYDEARNDDPEIALANGELIQALPPAPVIDVFISAGNEQDDKDPVPGAIRPGALVPGFGDKGYHALGAIEERGLQSGVALKTRHYANEIVLDISSTPMRWTTEDAFLDLEPWSPLLVHAGTGVEVGRNPAADGVLITLYLRQPELGGEPELMSPNVSEDNGWFRLAEEDTLGTGAAVWASMMAPAAQLSVPELAGHDACIYVVAGEITLDDITIPDSRLALIRHPEQLSVRANADTMILAILVRRDAPLTRAGTVAR